MRHLKTYESITTGSTIDEFIEKHNDSKPKVGDWCICKENLSLTIEEEVEVDNFLNTNVGEIIAIRNDDYLVKYTNIPKSLISWFTFFWKGVEKMKYTMPVDGIGCRRMNISEIKYWNKDKEELEIMINANKYNL